ncbi:MAG: hypothetical protein SGJ27_29625 [Candidatus Melainabacteria bacterium]|nr:hypothetical protein [Candidatus Melainabacteria bacterium]
MCGHKITESNVSCSYSLSVPNYQVYDLQTIIITCSEIERKLPEADLQRLHPYAYLTLPGGRFADPVDQDCSADALCFLEALMMSAKSVEDIVVCFHTGCKYFDTRPDKEQSVIPLFNENLDRDLDIIHAPQHETFSGSFADENLLIPVQRKLASELSVLESVCKRNKQLASKRLKFHGWLFEPEIDWVSFLDHETGQFLPLNASSIA